MFPRERIPVARQETALEYWISGCICLVFAALSEYAYILFKVSASFDVENTVCRCEIRRPLSRSWGWNEPSMPPNRRNRRLEQLLMDVQWLQAWTEKLNGWRSREMEKTWLRLSFLPTVQCGGILLRWEEQVKNQCPFNNIAFITGPR